jgi:alpha-amylase
MNNYQILHYHFTLALKDISFLEVSEGNELVPEEFNNKRFHQTFKAEIGEKLDALINFLKAKNEALVYFSGSFLEMLEKESLSRLNTLQKYVENGQIELVASCAYHSFSYLCHPELFKKEVSFHQQAYQKYFEKEAKIFINTACLFDDKLVEYLHDFNFETLIATANSWHLSGTHAAETFQSVGDKPMRILLSNGDSNSNTFLSLANGYGSAYDNSHISHSSLESLKKMMYEEEHPSTYSASMPLSSPEWEYPISNYLANPLQKALLNECKRLVDAQYQQLAEEDWKAIMLICQPEKLIHIHKAEQSNGYQSFINSMNILTAIGLKLK